MTLTLSILRCPDGVPPETRRVSGGEFTIGRGTECDWVLPDPERVLSKRHCVVAFDGRVWRVTDTSTNGTFLNQETDRLDPDAPRLLRDGDRLVFGAYEIEAAFDRQPSAPVRDGPARDGDPRYLADDRLTRDPFPMMGADPLAVALPSDDVALNAGQDGWSVDKFIGSPRAISDNAPVIQESFRAPRSSFELLPDDWDAEGANDAAPASAGSAPPVEPRAAPPTPWGRRAEPRYCRRYPYRRSSRPSCRKPPTPRTQGGAARMRWPPSSQAPGCRACRRATRSRRCAEWARHSAPWSPACAA